MWASCAAGAGEIDAEIPVGAGGHCLLVLRGHNGQVAALLLCGGDKSTQQKDIDKALELAAEWRAEQKKASDDDK